MTSVAQSRHPTQEELLNGAIRTIEEIFLPELRTSWAKASAVQLVGLLRYALQRQAEDIERRQDAELLDCLRALPPNVQTSALTHRPDGPALRGCAGALLIHAQGADDALAVAIGASLRPLLARHTAEDLAEAGPLLHGFMTGFRGMKADAD